MSKHVDDFYVISTQQFMLDDLYNFLVKKYQHVSKKQCNTIMEYLGMSSNRLANGDISISQLAYIEKMLEISGMTEANGAPTPYAVTQTPMQDDDVKVDKHVNLSYVGLINYLACYTRPDLLYALFCVSQSCSDPNKADMRRVIHIFRFIISTKDDCLVFKSNIPVILYAWVDASYDYYIDGKSQYSFNLAIGYESGSFVSKSGKIKLVA